MDILEKAKRIKALVHYTNYSSIDVRLNYQLNQMLSSDGKEYIIKLSDVYDNVYAVYNDEKPVNITDEQFERIVSDVYTQFYHNAYLKANKIALEKITIAEIELNIMDYENK